MPVAGKVYVRMARANNSLRHQGEWRVAAPLQLACAAYKLFAHTFKLQTDRQTGLTSQPGYTLHRLPLQPADAKI